LKDVDFVGMSDPICYIFIREDEKAQWNKFDQTELIKDNLNPDFEKSFIINYYFERHQYLKFEVYDGLNASGSLDLIGTVETSLGYIVGAKN
jgi:Ca2+-dependent lipid-binding protein